MIKKFTVEVKGAVEKPGILTLGGSYNIEEIINIAGGFKEIANTSNISLLLPKKMKIEFRILAKYNYLSDEKDTLIKSGSV